MINFLRVGSPLSTLTIFFLLPISSLSWAHHGWGGYNNDIDTSLVVTELRLGNAHDQLVATDSEGQAWALVLATPARNRRLGFDENTLSVGDEIIGTGPDKEIFENRLKSLGLEKWVTFTGWVENQFDYLNIFDIFLFAGIADGLPYGLLEAMAFGKPVVATNNGAIHEAVTDGESGLLVEKRNPEAMANGIIRLLDDKKLCEKLKINAEKNCRKYFDIKKMHSEIREFVDRLL